MQTLWQDLRFGARTLWNKPSFTLVAVITLSLGIGPNTPIFTLIDRAWLRMLRVRESERLALLGTGQAGGVSMGFPDGRTELFSYSFYRDVRRRNQVFSDVAAVQNLPSLIYGVVSGAGGDAEIIDAR